MKTAFLFLVIAFNLAAFKTQEDFFTGKILYKYSFTDLSGNNIDAKLVPYLGTGQGYFIDGKNYKTYNQDKLQQLYHSNSNTYYYFTGTQTAQKIDGSQIISAKHTVTRLNKTEKIAGYDCQAILVETDAASIVYFYSPLLKTDQKIFAKHNFGEWNKYLEATAGALPLKYILTNKKDGFIWTSVATEVIKMQFQPQDFALPDNIQIKE